MGIKGEKLKPRIGPKKDMKSCDRTRLNKSELMTDQFFETQPDVRIKNRSSGRTGSKKMNRYERAKSGKKEKRSYSGSGPGRSDFKPLKKFAN